MRRTGSSSQYQADDESNIDFTMAEPLKLEILSEKTLHQTVDPRLLTYCPSMDLVAVTSTDQHVFIYRLNGQRVYGAFQKSGHSKVESIRWKPNGSSTAYFFRKLDLIVEQANFLLLPGAMDQLDWWTLKAPKSYINSP
jgi:hypothetical protein